MTQDGTERRQVLRDQQRELAVGLTRPLSETTHSLREHPWVPWAQSFLLGMPSRFILRRGREVKWPSQSDILISNRDEIPAQIFQNTKNKHFSLHSSFQESPTFLGLEGKILRPCILFLRKLILLRLLLNMLSEYLRPLFMYLMSETLPQTFFLLND